MIGFRGFHFLRSMSLTGETGMHSSQSQDHRSTKFGLDFMRNESKMSQLTFQPFRGLGGRIKKSN